MSKHKNKPTKEQREELLNIWKSDLSVIEALEKRKEILGEQPLTPDEKQQLEQQFERLYDVTKFYVNLYKGQKDDNKLRYKKVYEAIKSNFKKEGKMLPPEHNDFWRFYVGERYRHLHLDVRDKIPEIKAKDFDLYHLYIIEGFSAPQQTNIANPDLTNTLIFFDKPKTIELLFDELKGYFPEKNTELKKALNGERLNKPLLFPHNGNRFVEVFRRLQYNGKLLNYLTEIRNWICLNFTFRYKKGTMESTKNFNKSTVYDILRGKEGTEPTKNQRLLQNVEWLPYKTKSRIKREAQEEQL